MAKILMDYRYAVGGYANIEELKKMIEMEGPTCGLLNQLVVRLPAIFTCQVRDGTKQQRFGEGNRRFVNVNPDTSANKIQAAKKIIG
jgi:hypothetical protein